MGCGASAVRAQPALDPGELRDLSQPSTVVLQEGVAVAGQRDPREQKRNSLKDAVKAEPQEVFEPSVLRVPGQEAQQQESPKTQAPEQPASAEAAPPLPQLPGPEAERQLRKQNTKSTSQRITAPPPEEQDPEPSQSLDPDPPETTGDVDSDARQQLQPPEAPEPSAPPPAAPAVTPSCDGDDGDSGKDGGAACTAAVDSATDTAAAESSEASSQPSFSPPLSPPPPANPDPRPDDPTEMWGPKAAAAKAGAAASEAAGSRAGSSSSSASSAARTHAPKPPAGSPPPKQLAVAAAAPPPPAAQPPSEPSPLPPQPRMVDCAVSLQFLLDFCGRVPEDMPTWKVVTEVIVPVTRERRCRYVEMLERHLVGHCDYFISHRWATPFSHLVRYVRKHLVELGDVVEDGGDVDGAAAAAVAAAAAAAEGVVVTKATKAAVVAGEDDEEAGPKHSADQVFVWCDIFAINQHPGQVQADDLAQLKDCVEASQQTLLCLDDKGLVLTRIWCLYEIWNTVLAGGPPKLAVLGYDVNQDAFKEVYITLDVEEAQATVDSDRVRILADIAASTGLQELNLVLKNALLESTQAEAENALKVLLPRATDWKDFQRVIEAVNKHLQMLTTLGRHQEAQRYGYIIQAVSTTWQKAVAAKTHGSASDAGSGARISSTSGAQPEPGGGAAGGSGGGGGSGLVGAAAAGVVAGGGGGGGGGEAVPVWHWRTHPRDAALRQVLDRAAAAERHGHFDSAIALHRDALDKAEQRLRAASDSEGSVRRPSAGGAGGGGGGGGGSASAAAAAASLDLAGCRLRLGMLLAMRGFVDQAVSEAGEPAVAAFEAHAGARSLAFASAAFQVALLAKNSWERKDMRTRLLNAAYDIQDTQLGPTHEATLDTLREKAELTYMSGDFEAGIELFRKLAVRLSEGTDLAARPPSSASAASAAAAAAAASEFSAKALEVWFLLASYLSGREGREDEVIRICRALIPHKRRDHIRRLRATAADPTSEYAEQAVSELRRLGLSRAAAGSSRPSSTASSVAAGAGASGGGGGGGALVVMDMVEVEPDGLADPDDPRVDVITHSSELTLWSAMLAKQGRHQDAVLLQWRLAEACRGNKQMAALETQLPSGKVLMADAYERCLLLDLQVPGIAKVAAKMLAERDGDAGGGGDSSGGGAQAGGAAATAGAAAAKQPSYDGPGYMELVQQMTKLWSALDLAGAEPVCRQIITCQEAAHGSVSKEVVDAKEQLARLLQSAGRLEEAVSEMRAALAVHEQILHGKDPAMSRTLHTLGDMVPDRAEGERLHRRAVDLVTKVHGPDHFEVGQAVLQLGGFVMSSGMERMEEGQQLIARGQAILAKFQQRQQTMIKAF